MSDFQSILDEDDEPVETETPVETSENGSESAPAAAEAPTLEETETSAPVDVAAEAQPITRDDGAVWSENAKRWYLNGKIVAGEAPAAPSEASVPSVAAPLTPEAPVAPIVPTFAGDPFEVRGGGRKHAIPGAVIDKDGWVHIPPDAKGQTASLLAAGIHHNSTWQQERQTFQQQIQQAEARAELRSKKYNDASVFLFDKLAGFLGDHPQELSMIQRELGLMLKSADLDIPKTPAQPEVSQEQIEQRFAATLTDYIDEVLETVPGGLFTAEDIADLKATAQRRMAAYAAEHEGDLVLDTHAVKADLAREVKLAQRAQQKALEATTAAQKAKAAAAFNAANTPKPPAVPPRKPSPTPAHAAAPSGQKPSWDQAVKRAWADDDD